MDEDFIKYVELLKKDSVDVNSIKSYFLKIKEMFDEFVDNTRGELTKDECLEQFLDAYREDLNFAQGIVLRNAFILNQYCSYKDLMDLYKGNKAEFRRILVEAKNAEKQLNKEELKMTLNTKNQSIISVREMLRQKPNISEKELLITFQKRRGLISDFLKAEYIKSIQENVSFLNEYGRIDEYIKMANQELEKVGLSGVLYQKRNPIPDEYGDGKGNFIRYDENKKQYVKYDDNGNVVNDGEDLSGYEQDIGVIDSFDESYLMKLSLEDLFMMDLFWRCMYFDERMKLSKTMYAMEKMNLWNLVLDGKKGDIENIDSQSILDCFEVEDAEKPLIKEEIANIKNTAHDLTIQECIMVSKLKAKDFSIRSWGTIDFKDEDEHVNIAMDNVNFRGTVVISVPKVILENFIESETSKLPKYKDAEKMDENYSNIMGKLYVPATNFFKKYVMSKYKENPSSKLYAGLVGKKVKNVPSMDDEGR